jgi:phage-related protein|nr:MAG TPA: tail tape measure protein [Caudoviricetes sp.]
MSDNANKMGTSMESIQNAYQGFAKQNYTMLDNLKLGYGGTKEEMERLIEDANRVKEANGEMADLSIESFADVTEAIHIIQTEMGITGTTATEASTTIEGSVNSMKSAWENLVTDLGKGNADIGESVDELMDSVETALDNIIPAVQQILENITTAIPEIIPRVIEGLSSIITEVLPSLL